MVYGICFDCKKARLTREARFQRSCKHAIDDREAVASQDMSRDHMAKVSSMGATMGHRQRLVSLRKPYVDRVRHRRREMPLGIRHNTTIAQNIRAIENRYRNIGIV